MLVLKNSGHHAYMAEAFTHRVTLPALILIFAINATNMTTNRYKNIQ